MNDFQTSQAAPEAAPRHTCRCGHTRDHPLVTHEVQYSTFNWLLGVLMGVSAGHPKRIRFRCRKCGEVVEESTDRKLIYTYHQ
jgi:hypothetical protein